MRKIDDQTSLLKKYILSCTAATVAETVTYPLDIVKTRLQIQGELKSKNISNSNGMFRITVNIVKQEGFAKLWTGVTPAVYRHLVYTGCRLVFYEQFRDAIKKNYNVFPLWLAVLVGSSSGALAQFIASPTDLVKVKMQADRQKSNEVKKGVYSTLVQIYKDGGVKGLWRGSVVNVQRAALVNLGDLATYDLVKQYAMKKFNLNDDYKTHTLASICSGLIAATMGTPADVVKTRIMCQPIDTNGKGTIYKSSFHCLQSTIFHEGFLGLYKGFWPTWLRMAPWSLTFWITYEQIRFYSGMNGF